MPGSFSISEHGRYVPEVHKPEETLHFLFRHPRDVDWRGVRVSLSCPRGFTGSADRQGKHVCEDLGFSRKVVSVDTKQRAIHLTIGPLMMQMLERFDDVRLTRRTTDPSSK